MLQSHSPPLEGQKAKNYRRWVYQTLLVIAAATYLLIISGSPLTEAFWQAASLVPESPKMLVMKLSFTLALFAVIGAGQGSTGSNEDRSSTSTAIGGTPFPPLIEATLEDIVKGLHSGLFTSVDLVNAYSARVMEVNSTLRMVTELNPDALSIAAETDRLRANGTVLGPLHGIPILLKNNIATMDDMANTAGSYALVGAKVPRDSTMAAKLRKAGAVLLGKTNLSQWANYRSSNTSNGWSALGGQTEGAYYPGQDPSGSSSGSGVASSLGLALACLGTETDGSIVSPAGVNNLVGIKPTVGLTSRYLVVPVSEHQDTVGPMARTVKDAAYILSAITGPDPNDNYTSAFPFDTVPDYVGACDYSGLKGKRLGVPRNLFMQYSDVEEYRPQIRSFDASLDVFRAAGAEIVDNVDLEGADVLASSNFENVVLMADFLTDVANYFSELTVNPHNITSLAELQEFTQGTPMEGWPGRDTQIWQDALDMGFDNTSPEFWSNYTADLYNGGLLGVTGAIKNMSLDALIMPTTFSSTLPAVIGSPIVTVPLGRYPDNTTVVSNQFGNLNATGPNLPFGIAFLGEHFGEEKLISLAYAFEQRTKVRNTIKPYIQPKTELVDIVKKKE
ncbi:glutamyl-tRNA(Gln) amidotransferase subunit A [Apiospora rasikravindrae]|uniref:Glutamyl-tRNA(Gln) amidotransferase subunit A n=1 Tax=Apiospora rasikravindrae TaxID=990691 RepID=A0ABR1S1V9_9PEZI